MTVVTNNHIKCNRALAALQQVKDPEIGLNVVDLGLVYQLDFDDLDEKVYVQMTLTTQFCPMGESIVHAVRNALQDTFVNERIEVNLTFNPRWNRALISEAGRIFLNK